MNETKPIFSSKNRYRDRVSLLVSWGHWYAFFNILIAIAIGVQYITANPFPSTLLGQFYLLVSWLGHFAFLVFALYILVLFPLTFIISSFKYFRIVSVLLTTLGFTLLILDAQAYEQLNIHLNPKVWELLLGNESKQFTEQWQYLFIVVPVMLFLQIVLSEWVWKKQRSLGRKKIGKPAALILFVCFLLSHLIYVWADAYFYRPITSQQANFPLSYPMTAKSFMEKHGLLDQEDYATRLEQSEFEAEHIQYPKEKLTYSGLGKDYNVLVVTINNLRSDMVDKNIMPNTFYFAQDNQWFKKHYSASNNGYGIFGLWYGLPSNYLPSINANLIAPLVVTQAQKNDYQMATFNYGKHQDLRLYQAISNKFSVNQVEDSDEKIFTAFDSWLKNTPKQPWFSYVELDQVFKFENLEEISPAFANVNNSPEAELKARYQTAAYQTDQIIARIIESLKQTQALDNTIVIITSDHGYEFNETGKWGYNSNFSAYQLQVPMIIHWPNKVAKAYDYKTSHLDISPTLLQQLFDVTNNAYDISSGRSLFESNNRSWILANNEDEIALVTDQYITVLDENGNYKVYHPDYRRDRESKPKLSLILQGLSELKRFYREND